VRSDRSCVEHKGNRAGSRRGRTRATLLALGSLAVAALGQPALASAHEVAHDRVIGDPVVSGKPTASASSTSAGTPYPVPGGGTVKLIVDPAWAGTDAVQRVLGTLGGILHGGEIDKLTVHIADDGSLAQRCGAYATACYFPASMTMVISGSPTNPNNQMPQAMVITHEYGHHIEANRSFEGWYATNLGGRHWATYEQVCEGVAAGRLYPGDQGAHYWENPGEAFAQAYATRHYPSGRGRLPGDPRGRRRHVARHHRPLGSEAEPRQALRHDDDQRLARRPDQRQPHPASQRPLPGQPAVVRRQGPPQRQRGAHVARKEGQEEEEGEGAEVGGQRDQLQHLHPWLHVALLPGPGEPRLRQGQVHGGHRPALISRPAAP
jgi:hypothetical protein